MLFYFPPPHTHKKKKHNNPVTVVYRVWRICRGFQGLQRISFIPEIFKGSPMIFRGFTIFKDFYGC